MANITSTDIESRQYLYKNIVSEFSDQIRSGHRKPGSKMPSLRKFADNRGVSIATVLAAYQELVAFDMIETRPKSGYFVRLNSSDDTRLPSRTNPNRDPISLSIRKPFIALLDHASRKDVAPLGCAVPSASLLETVKIDNLMNRINRSSHGQFNTYAPAFGMPELRYQLAKRHSALGILTDPEELIITNGCTEALSLALQTIARAGDVIAVESPTYFGVLQILASQGLKALELPTDHRGILPEGLQSCLKRHNVAACLLPSGYSNPLGATMPDSRKATVLDILARYDVPLVEDDIYGDLTLKGLRPKPFISFSSDAEVIYCASFSKSLAPGYRVGWIHTKSRFEKIGDHKFAASLCNAMLPQITVARFLETGAYDRHIRKLRPVLQNNLEQARALISEHFPKGTKISNPKGGFVLWLELHEDFDSERLFQSALEKNICFAPGTLFSANNTYRNCLRISCGHPWDAAISTAIQTLGSLASIQAHKSAPRL